MTLQVYIGYAAGLLQLIVFALLIRSMMRGVTKPNLAGWVLYTVAMGMIVASSIALHAWQALWLAISYLFGQVVVILFSLRSGYFGFTKFDYTCIALSFLGLLLWLNTSNPLYALVLNVVVDALGTLTIARKLYLHRETEDRLAWSFGAAVALLNVFAIASFDLANALYPIYVLLATTLIAVLCFRRIDAK